MSAQTRQIRRLDLDLHWDGWATRPRAWIEAEGHEYRRPGADQYALPQFRAVRYRCRVDRWIAPWCASDAEAEDTLEARGERMRSYTPRRWQHAEIIEQEPAR